MLHFLDPFRGIDALSVLLKMVCASVLGASIGLERSYKNRPAGVRTHVLVSAGAAAASLTGIYLHLTGGYPLDITRLSAAVVSGLSFLGVGTIIVTKNYTVKGLTTAAGLWVAGIIGLCAGAGFYEGAVLAAVLVLLTESSLTFVRDHIKKDPHFTVEILSMSKEALDQVMRCFKNHHITITNIRITSSDAEEGHYYLAFLSLRSRSNLDRQEVYAEASAIEGIREFTELQDPDES